MPSQPDPVGSEYAETAESIRSGEYFRKARTMYDLSVHDLMTERYLYIFVTFLSLIIFIIAVVAMRSLYPLSTSVPFIFNATDIVDEIPNIHSLMTHKDDTPGTALLRFFVRNYVTMREEYDINTFDRDRNGVSSQCSPQVLAQYLQEVNPANPQSPIALYQRYSTRKIDIVASRLLEDGEMEVVYEATVEGGGKTQNSRWQANIAFKYSGLALDQKTGKIKPVSFTVTRYRTKRLQDTM